MRLRDQFIVILAVVFATIAVGVNVFAQNRAGEQRADNARAAIAATWAQPIVPTTTITSTTSSEPILAPTRAEPSPTGTEAPGQNKENCVPPGQVDRDDDKDTPPGQDRDMCVPPGQDKDETTPPGQVDRDQDKTAPLGQNKDGDTPPGQDNNKGKADKDD